VLVGFVSLAGKRDRRPRWCSAGPLTACRAERSPRRFRTSCLVGWETVLVSLATLATATVFSRLGWGGGDATKIVAFLVVAAIVVLSGIFAST